MPFCVPFCRAFILLGLSLLFFVACSPASEPSDPEITQNFYYDPSPEAPFEEFRYEWVATGEVAPWQFYYGLVYWRFARQEVVDFAIPYFLVKNKKENRYPVSFSLEDTRGNHWQFKRINDENDLNLPFSSPSPLQGDLNALPETSQETTKEIFDHPHFGGRVYVLEPLDEQSPLDWATLRLFYEMAQNQETFTFEWQEDPASPIKDFHEPDRTLFRFHLAEEGFQTFMSTLKRWGIS